MSIYHVATYSGISYPPSDCGLTLRNGISHGNLTFPGATHEKAPLLQKKGAKSNVPYELWISAQAPWKPLVQSAESNSEKASAAYPQGWMPQ